MTRNTLFWSLPYTVRQLLFKWQNQQEFKKLQTLRTQEPEKLSAPTFKPFIDNKCIFVHIPKVAGVSVGYSLFQRHTGNHTSISEYQMVFSQKEFKRFFKFTFVRNPWDRLLSAYLFLIGGGRNQGDKKWADQHLSDFKSFDDFVLNWVSQENVNLGVHFKPQYLFVTNPGSMKLLVDFVGKFENLETDYQVVKKKLGFGDDLKFENKTKGKSDDYQKHYSPKTQEIVANVYKEDIALFGYKF